MTCSINWPRNSRHASGAANGRRSRNTPIATRSWPRRSASCSRRWSRWSRPRAARQGEDEEETGDSRAANPPLRQIGDYRILREIGRGGMGVVYEAEQISLGRRVALKVLPRQVSGDRLVQERFRREARAAARLHHTNIVPVYEVGQDGDVRFYAMQFIQGQGLDTVITELRRLRDRSRIRDPRSRRPLGASRSGAAVRALRPGHRGSDTSAKGSRSARCCGPF